MSHKGHKGKQGWPGMNEGDPVPEGWELDPVWGPINGALRPLPSSPLWNDWAAEHPTPEAKGLANIPPLTETITPALSGIFNGARPIE